LDHGLQPAYGAPFCTRDAITKVPPVYPDLARERNVDGQVEVAALVCEHGRVVEIRVHKTDSHLLDQAAMTAVAEWKFAVAPAACWVNTPVNFRLH